MSSQPGGGQFCVVHTEVLTLLWTDLALSVRRHLHVGCLRVLSSSHL